MGNQIAQMLRKTMREGHVTQQDLARLTGVSQGRISDYATGKLTPSAGMLEFLFSALGSQVDVRVDAEPASFNRSERRSWALHRRIAALLDADTLEQWTEKLLSNIERLTHTNQGQPHLDNITTWRILIDNRDLRGIRRALLDTGAHGRAMREVSPFAGLLSETDRQNVLRELAA